MHNIICYFLSMVYIVIMYTLYIVKNCNYQPVSLSFIRFYSFIKKDAYASFFIMNILRVMHKVGGCLFYWFRNTVSSCLLRFPRNQGGSRQISIRKCRGRLWRSSDFSKCLYEKWSASDSETTKECSDADPKGE